MPSSRRIVFAHRVWADGSSFSKVIPPLRAEGHQVLASEHGLDNQDDVDCCVRSIARSTRPVCSSATPTAAPSSLRRRVPRRFLLSATCSHSWIYRVPADCE